MKTGCVPLFAAGPYPGHEAPAGILCRERDCPEKQGVRREIPPSLPPAGSAALRLADAWTCPTLPAPP